jgi:hypothetical protein
MSTGGSEADPERELFRKASDAIRELGSRWLRRDDRDCDEFRAISAALTMIEDAEFAWQCRTNPPESLDHVEMLEGVRRRAREAFALCRASARTSGEVRLLALQAIDEKATNMKSLVEALAYYSAVDAACVQMILARELVGSISWLRSPDDTRVVVPPRDTDEILDAAWRALVVWESTGATSKWAPVNALLGHFGLASETPAALRHLWATRNREHWRHDFARDWREYVKNDPPTLRIDAILRQADRMKLR